MSGVPVGNAELTVVFCDGHRCRALRGRIRTRPAAEDQHDLLQVLREVVRGRPGAVLVRSACIGACHRAPAVLLLPPPEQRRSPAAGLLVGPVEQPDQVAGLVDLIRWADLPPA